MVDYSPFVWLAVAFLTGGLLGFVGGFCFGWIVGENYAFRRSNQ